MYTFKLHLTMRPLFLFLCIISSSLLNAQNCDNLQFKKGATFDRETYDNKDKKTATIKSRVKDIKESASRKEASIHTEYYDAKDVKQHEGDVKVVCEGDQLLIDIRDLLNSNPLANNPDFEMEIENSVMETPSKLIVGQSLPATSMTIKMKDKKSGMEFGAMKVNIVNRKVEGKESITTPAGTFACFKITSEMKMEMIVMGANREMPAVKNAEYISNGFGTVKTVSFNEKGEMTSYSVLSKYTE